MIIGIWGQAGTGNSTLAVTLGKYLTKNGIVLIVDTDLTQPTLPTHIKSKVIESSGSLGRALNIGMQEATKYMHQDKKYKRLFYAGLTQQDTILSYEYGFEIKVERRVIDAVFPVCLNRKTKRHRIAGSDSTDRTVRILVFDREVISKQFCPTDGNIGSSLIFHGNSNGSRITLHQNAGVNAGIGNSHISRFRGPVCTGNTWQSHAENKGNSERHRADERFCFFRRGHIIGSCSLGCEIWYSCHPQCNISFTLCYIIFS